MEKKKENTKQKHKEYAELIGIENLRILSRVFGGTSIYIPKEEELQKEEKYNKILEEFTGGNTKELAIKYKVSERTIYRIVEQNKIKKQGKNRMENQISIFDSNHF